MILATCFSYVKEALKGIKEVAYATVNLAGPIVLYVAILFIIGLVSKPALLSAQVPTATASRDIAIQNLSPGATTQVTINFTSLLSQPKAFGLKENIPSGWILTRGTETPPASAFKPETNEWVWFSLTPAATTTVTYTLTMPITAPAGNYSISGTVLADNITNNIAGEAAITSIGITATLTPAPTLTPTPAPALTPVLTSAPTPASATKPNKTGPPIQIETPKPTPTLTPTQGVSTLPGTIPSPAKPSPDSPPPVSEVTPSPSPEPGPIVPQEASPEPTPLVIAPGAPISTPPLLQEQSLKEGELPVSSPVVIFIIVLAAVIAASYLLFRLLRKGARI